MTLPAPLPAKLAPSGAVPEGTYVPADRSIQWIQAGWQIFMSNPGMWVLVALLLTLLLAILPLLLPGIGSLVVLMLCPAFLAGLVLGCDALKQRQELPLDCLFAGLRGHAGALLQLGMFYLVAAAAVVFVGLMLALLPGVAGFNALNDQNWFGFGSGLFGSFLIGGMALYVPWVLLMMALWFAPALVVFRDQTPLNAMRASVKACAHNIGAFTLLGLALYVCTWLALLPTLGLGFLVLVPVVAGTMYASFLDVFGSAPNTPLR